MDPPGSLRRNSMRRDEVARRFGQVPEQPARSLVGLRRPTVPRASDRDEGRQPFGPHAAAVVMAMARQRGRVKGRLGVINTVDCRLAAGAPVRVAPQPDGRFEFRRGKAVRRRTAGTG